MYFEMLLMVLDIFIRLCLSHTLHIAVKCAQITLVLGTELSWRNYCTVSHFCEELFIMEELFPKVKVHMQS